MPYPATDVAFIFVKKGIEENNPITQMKLQKLVYFAHGLFLAMYDGKPLINEHFQAWQFGPVVPKLYYQYKFYGNKPINDTDWITFMSNGESYSPILGKDEQDVLNTIWKSLKNVSATQLSNWTHKEGSPWQKFYNPNQTDIEIPNEEIEQYFKTNFLNNVAAL